MNNKNQETNSIIYSIWLIVFFLCAFGSIVVYSASMNGNNHSSVIFNKQLTYILAGMVLAGGIQFLNYKILYKRAVLIYILSIGTIFLLLTPLGVTVKGATRWLDIKIIQFQVAELVKIGVIIIMAYMVQLNAKHLNRIKLIVLMWVLGGIATLLLFVISNDLSSSLILLAITFGITFVYTTDVKVHLLTVFGVGSGAFLWIWNVWRELPSAAELEDTSFRVGRIAAWLDPERYAADQGYQTLQALYAIGHGGFFGQGLGKSTQKISAIPEAQNDMIFSILCEELGVFGAIVLILMYIYLLYLLYKATKVAKDYFGSALVTGVMLHIGVQALINISVNLNVIPNTGIGLPFISYGGTSVLALLFEIAMVASVIRHSGFDNQQRITKSKKK